MPEEILGRPVELESFSVLGVYPFLGRDFLAEEDNANTGDVAILSHALWRQSFGGDPKIVGKKIELDNQEYTVVGVMPQGFEFPDRASAISVPLGLRRNKLPTIIGIFYRSWRVSNPKLRSHKRTRTWPLCPRIIRRKKSRQQYAHQCLRGPPPAGAAWGIFGWRFTFFWARSGFVLLIACANVANLLLARAAGRQRELAVRMALGAGRQRILRQLLTESLLLAGLAGIFGIMLSFWAAALLSRLIPAGVPLPPDSGIDARVFVFSVFVSMATGVLFGMMPALRLSSVNLSDALKWAGRDGADRVLTATTRATFWWWWKWRWQ